jgi:hypothetical protein
MPRPSHRLDLVLVPHDGPIERGEEALSLLVAHGVIDATGAPGPRAGALGVGHFARVRLDRPVSDGSPTLYANRTGGFRVRCPDTGGNLVPAFSRALSERRAGHGSASLTCPHCGASHPLDRLDFAPPAAFGHWALEVADIERRPEPGAEALRALLQHLGPVTQVLRR